MQKPGWLSTQLTVGNILIVCTLVFGFGSNYARMEASDVRQREWMEARDKQYAERRATTDAALAAINAKIAPIDSMLYRLGQQENATGATNQRIDRVVDSFAGRLEKIQNDVTGVGTKVEVLTRQIELTRKKAEGASLSDGG